MQWHLGSYQHPLVNPAKMVFLPACHDSHMNSRALRLRGAHGGIGKKLAYIDHHGQIVAQTTGVRHCLLGSCSNFLHDLAHRRRTIKAEYGRADTVARDRFKLMEVQVFSIRVRS
jgi:hypothetical protein